MTTWAKVGEWLKDNAGTGATLIGSLLTGNVPGAVAAGIAMVSSATGTDNAAQALAQLQADPQTLIRLKELALQESDNIRKHLETMKAMELEDEQKSHEQTQTTVRGGDVAEDVVVRRTRPLQSWASLIFSFLYVGWQTYYEREIDIFVLAALLTLSWTYAGLREVGKTFQSLLALRKK
jgi:hypothetical protein